MAGSRMLKLGFILHGVGRGREDWRHPDMDVTASTNFGFYARQTQLCEKASSILSLSPTVFRSQRKSVRTCSAGSNL